MYSWFKYGTLLACLSAEVSAGPSQLWINESKTGFGPGRLADFSRAGYQEGDRGLPRAAATVNVRDFGAVGDGETDDTRAFQAALDAKAAGVVEVPPGRYRITDFLRLRRSGVVLRGAGPDRSVLWFPLGLDEVHPRAQKTATGERASGYSFDGAFVTLSGKVNSRPLAELTAPARRGDRSLQVPASVSVPAGSRVLVSIEKDDAAQSLMTYLHAGDPGDVSKGKRFGTRMVARVVGRDGDRLLLDRPLRFDLRPEWSPRLGTFEPTVEEVGVEGLGFEFPSRKYGGHFLENGANAIELRDVSNCWIRNVRFHNTDLGVNVVATFCTLSDLVFTADPQRATSVAGTPCFGHHAIQVKHAEDNLITRFDIRASHVHDLAVEHASGNVFSRGRGSNLNLDHHRDAPHTNLFSDLDCGAATRVWSSGGGPGLGRQSASWGTFWNLRGQRPIALPSADWSMAELNFVGVRGEPEKSPPPATRWVELADEAPEPADLHSAQVALRHLGAAQTR